MLAPTNTLERELHTGAPAQASRLASLDAFRGLVIMTMTLVNYLAGVTHIPAWAKHTPETTDGFTFVDVVFPGFLFIVGVALPLAFHKRMERGESVLGLLRRIFIRSVSLLFVGVIMVNSSFFSAAATGVSRALWFLLAMLCVVVLWNHYPHVESKGKRRLYLVVRIIAGLMLAALLVMFRGKNDAGATVWFQHSWWGILGLIGWAYLVCSIAYLLFRGNSVALMGVLGFMLALYIGDKHGALDWDWLGPVHNFVGIGAVLGSTAADVMIGVLVGSWFVGDKAWLGPWTRARSFLLFGIGLYLAGMVLRPLHGIHKNAATESYALVTGGICCLAFLLVYVLMDVMNWEKWAAPFVPIGQNALLAYILPGMLGNFCAVIGLGGVLWQYGSGWSGALNAAVLTLLVLCITWGATKAGVRLKL